MEVAILAKKEVTSKKNGQSYEIYNGISKEGSPIEIFLNTEEARKLGIPTSGVVTPQETVAEFFEKATLVKVEFDQKGKVLSVTV